MSAARTERLLSLLTLLLNSRRPITFEEIALLEGFEAYAAAEKASAQRAFERDKASLVELGVPLRWVTPEDDDFPGHEGEGGYLVDRKRYYLPEIQFEADDMARLTLAASSAMRMPHFPAKDALMAALAKLGFDSEDGDTQHLRRVHHRPLAKGVDSERVGRHLELLQAAIVAKRTLRMTYAPPQGEPQERRFDPYTLYYRHGLWYAIGYCHLREHIRTFHLGRMQRVDETQAHFEADADFDVATYRDKKPWNFGEGPTQKVELSIDPSLRGVLKEVFDLDVAEASANEPLMITLEATNPSALIPVVLPYGSQMQVLSPQALREEIRSIYESLAGRYGQGGVS